jgi:5-formyltetrahydrofolate cyclo-ligase
MDKQELRKRSMEIRKNIPNKEQKNNAIYNAIISCDEYNAANIIAIYNSMGSEVNTKEIILYSLLKQKIVLLPKIDGEDMLFVRVDSNTKYALSKFGTLEPIEGEIYDPDKIDLFIVPGLAFDINGNRLGYGGGYYDRYLRELRAVKIGLAFEEQLVNSIPTEEKDIPLNIIQTEENRYVRRVNNDETPKRLVMEPTRVRK